MRTFKEPYVYVLILGIIALGAFVWLLTISSGECRRDGGTISTTFLYLQPIVVDKTVILMPVYSYECVRPQETKP